MSPEEINAIREVIAVILREARDEAIEKAAKRGHDAALLGALELTAFMGLDGEKRLKYAKTLCEEIEEAIRALKSEEE